MCWEREPLKEPREEENTCLETTTSINGGHQKKDREGRRWAKRGGKRLQNEERIRGLIEQIRIGLKKKKSPERSRIETQRSNQVEFSLGRG